MAEKTYKHINVRPETYDLIIKRCVEEFLKNNPQFRQINITQDFIIDRIGRYYLGERF